ncbi:hypothetical protein C8J57DRAFT_1218688 [Mycena rebaudengoi]|nr:hypothetical protein C8J57DRAFT_1218688 [Mycena rebaudengoi]
MAFLMSQSTTFLPKKILLAKLGHEIKPNLNVRLLFEAATWKLGGVDVAFLSLMDFMNDLNFKYLFDWDKAFAINACGLFLLFRVPSKTAFDYMVLDAGAGGVIIPHIDTPKEIRAVIGTCRFPSFSPFAFIPDVTDIAPEGETISTIANKHVAIIPQFVGIQNLEAILAVPEINAFMIGGDLPFGV